MPQATPVLFGAVYLSKSLAPLAKRVGFRVVVVDDRAFFADPGLFPDADEVIVAEFDVVFQKLAVHRDSYVVIFTRGHLHDATVLEQALSTEAAYLGMIGSRTKIRTIYRELQAGGVAADHLERVHALIGLPIAARSPEEIAVSILAELISVRNGGQATRAMVSGR